MFFPKRNYLLFFRFNMTLTPASRLFWLIWTLNREFSTLSQGRGLHPSTLLAQHSRFSLPNSSHEVLSVTSIRTVFSWSLTRQTLEVYPGLTHALRSTPPAIKPYRKHPEYQLILVQLNIQISQGCVTIDFKRCGMFYTKVCCSSPLSVKVKELLTSLNILLLSYCQNKTSMF